MPIQFRYAHDVHAPGFRQLHSRALNVDGVDVQAAPSAVIARLTAIADRRLAGTSEGELPEIQAWRRAFSAMGLKPTGWVPRRKPC